jgi:hypothetical protein
MICTNCKFAGGTSAVAIEAVRLSMENIIKARQRLIDITYKALL